MRDVLFGRSLVDCLNNIQALEKSGVRFIAVTQGLDTDQKNPASRFLLHVLGAAAEFERELIRERSAAGRLRYADEGWDSPCRAVRGGTCRHTARERFSTGTWLWNYEDRGFHFGR
jgi:hypothetical protein